MKNFPLKKALVIIDYAGTATITRRPSIANLICAGIPKAFSRVEQPKPFIMAYCETVKRILFFPSAMTPSFPSKQTRFHL